MLRKYQIILGLVAGLGMAHAAAAFTVWGPLESWQTAELDYGDRGLLYGEVENGGSKLLGAGARLNVPVITYGFDYTFLEYFGTQGIKAVDAAMAVMNALPTASTANLNSFVTEQAQQIDYTAQALSLYDLKSATLSLLVEHAGLLGETHVFDLRARTPQATPVPCQFFYYVVERNYDPVTYDPTPYVNGVAYGYQIVDFCQDGTQVADAVELPSDTTRLGGDFTAVATKEGQKIGGYYTGLTRDDMGGLKYLYRQARLVNELIDANSFVTSFGSSSPWSPSGTTFTASNLLTTALFGGVEKVRYVKVQYNSLEGSAFTPVTYTYGLPAVVNGKLTSVRLSRIIFAPDIIFAAADLVDTAFSPPHVPSDNRFTAFTASPVVSPGGGVNGPGVTPSVIQAPFVVTFNNALPINLNEQPPFLSDGNVFVAKLFQWGYYNGSGSPVVFPNGATLLAAEQAALAPSTTTTQSTTWDPTFGFVTGAVTFLGNY